MTEPLPPGAVIGILGGGQLGRMLAMAAARLGMRAHVLDPGEDPPAAQVAWRHSRAPFDDLAALAAFGRAVDVATYEFENIPVAAVEAVARHAPVRPGEAPLAVAQDRLDEKDFLSGLGLATARYARVDGPDDIAAALAHTGAPALLKTRRMGYDGKGQARIAGPGNAATAWRAIGAVPAILEAHVPFTAELSVIGARGMDGAVVCYDPGLNTHEDGILRTTRVPAPLPRSRLQDAVLATGHILNALDYVGVIGVEFFAAPEGLIVNEFAPRVHNSGHWSQAGCAVDQFEQHVRAICGWPLGDGVRHADVAMTNLIGAADEDWPALAAEPGAQLHLYGKAESRPGRKMGHVNRVGPRS
ncbi:MAG TPA: 5-(carboxyamino)imidazole ribonucleotide synthase [Rhodobacteraceae bacterium]|jgi:5-(carboxyamino)imidazole ribonucleotide synthase|nr:5-(carboxyamino)imidazole ribonucleotide synthase [Paracoccaceae bacterium]HBG97773.1 5-(carboxyamino)imidazole ribonucleotide synthase [Paracoccaceae bacterium]